VTVPSILLHRTLQRLMPAWRGLAPHAALQAGASDERLLELHMGLVRSYPTHLLNSLNEVLFGQQGYTKMQRHGDPRDSLLSSVLERGNGSPAALAILYREVLAYLYLLHCWSICCWEPLFRAPSSLAILWMLSWCLVFPWYLVQSAVARSALQMLCLCLFATELLLQSVTC
jgi:hypothetical protein